MINLNKKEILCIFGLGSSSSSDNLSGSSDSYSCYCSLKSEGSSNCIRRDYGYTNNANDCFDGCNKLAGKLNMRLVGIANKSKIQEILIPRWGSFFTYLPFIIAATVITIKAYTKCK